MVAILDFQNISKWHFGQFLIALGVEIELRFALRSTVSEITAIKVDPGGHLGFFKTSQNGQMAFWAIAYCPRG